jgi:hypothetical protein
VALLMLSRLLNFALALNKVKLWEIPIEKNCLKT